MKQFTWILVFFLIIIIVFSSCANYAFREFENAYALLQQDSSIHYTENLSISSGSENYRYSYEYFYSDTDCLMIMDAGLDTEMITLCHDNETFYTYRNLEEQWHKADTPISLSYPWKEENLQNHSEWDYTAHYENDSIFLTFTCGQDSSIDYVIQNGRIIKVIYNSSTDIEDSDPNTKVFHVSEYILNEISDEDANNTLQSYITDLPS